LRTSTRLAFALETRTSPAEKAADANFTALDMSLPEVANLVGAMMRARDAVSRRSWSHPQEPTGEEWWADVVANPRARKRERRTDLAVKQPFYRLADEKREIILVACSKCDWRAAFSRDEPDEVNLVAQFT
jgi:hypothetical protein